MNPKVDIQRFTSGKARMLGVAILLIGAALISASLRNGTPAQTAFGVLVPATPAGNPLLFVPGTKLLTASEAEVTILDDFSLTSRPVVTFDGRKLLFSARRSGEAYSAVWELSTEGGSPRRIAGGESDYVTPIYLSDDRIAFCRVLSDSGSAPKQARVLVLNQDGSLRQISFGNSLDLIDHLLGDGRILLRRFTPGDSVGMTMALRADGTELARYLADDEAQVNWGQSPLEPPELAQSVRRKLTDRAPEMVLQGLQSIAFRPRPLIPTSLVNPELDYGWLVCLDVHNTDLDYHGRKGAAIEVIDGETGKSLGTGPIAADGSFFIRVPADRLLRLQVLDELNRPLATQSTGIWVRPNEHRGCPGCHEPRYRTPDNRFPKAVENHETVIAVRPREFVEAR